MPDVLVIPIDNNNKEIYMNDNDFDMNDDSPPQDESPHDENYATTDASDGSPRILPGMLVTNTTFRPLHLHKEQAKAQPVIESHASPTKEQHKALRTMRDCVAEAPGPMERIKLHGQRKVRREEVLKEVQKEADERGLFGRLRKIDIPSKLKWLAAVLSAILFTALHRAMLLFLGLSLGATTLFAAAISIAVETLAMVYGRSAAAKERSRVAEIELSHTDMVLLRFAPIIAMAIEMGMGVLRGLITGQWVTSFVMSLAGIALWWVSAYVNEHAFAGDEVDEKRAEKADEKASELLSQAERDLEKLRQRWHESKDILRDGAAVQLGRIQALTVRVDAAIRATGSEPSPWPLTAPIAQQINWATGVLDPSIIFPGEGNTAADGSPDPGGPPQLPSARAA